MNGGVLRAMLTLHRAYSHQAKVQAACRALQRVPAWAQGAEAREAMDAALVHARAITARASHAFTAARRDAAWLP